MTFTLKRFTAFAYGHDNPAPEVWVNPAQIAYVAPRIVTRGHADCSDGTRIYFNVDSGVLDVREPVGHVVAALQSGKGGLCKDCYEVLPESWMTLCTPCRMGKHCGIDEDYENALADVSIGPHAETA
jgi:hypothetical protein